MQLPEPPLVFDLFFLIGVSVLLDPLFFLIGNGFEFEVLVYHQAMSGFPQPRVKPRHHIFLRWRERACVMALVDKDELIRRLKLRESLLGLAEVLLQELLFGCVLFGLGYQDGLPTSLLLVADHCLSAWRSALVIFVNHCYHIRLRVSLVEEVC